MIIFPHLLIGAAIGSQVHNVWAVLFLSLGAHFIADKIPHWEYEAQELKTMDKDSFLFFLLKVATDASIGSLLLLLLLWKQNTWPYAIFGAFISALPDFPLFLLYFWPNSKWLNSYQTMHVKNHLNQRSKKKGLLPLISELVVAAIAILFIKF